MPARSHGMTNTPEYRSWHHMIQRCENPRDKSYARYGGRGIAVCQEWRAFTAFFRDMGPRPGAGYSIDRICNHLGYEPGNCRWATSKEQNQNRSNSFTVATASGSKSLAALAESHGLPAALARNRVQTLGWSVERALTEAPRSRYRTFLTIDGETKPVSEWAKVSGVPKSAIYRRVLRGWTARDAAFQRPERCVLAFRRSE